MSEKLPDENIDVAIDPHKIVSRSISLTDNLNKEIAFGKRNNQQFAQSYEDSEGNKVFFANDLKQTIAYLLGVSEDCVQIKVNKSILKRRAAVKEVDVEEKGCSSCFKKSIEKVQQVAGVITDIAEIVVQGTEAFQQFSSELNDLRKSGISIKQVIVENDKIEELC